MLFLIRRLIIPFVFLAALLAAVFAVFALAGVPLAEDRAAQAISGQLGGNPHVTVKAKHALGLGLIDGDLGDLVIHADRVGRQDFAVTDVRGRVYGASLDLGALVTGTTKISFSHIILHANLSSTQINSLMQARLASTGGAATKVKVRLVAGNASVVTPVGPLPITFKVAGVSTVRVVPSGGGVLDPLLKAVLVKPIDVGPLPYGLRLTSVRIVKGLAVVTAERGKGSETL